VALDDLQEQSKTAYYSCDYSRADVEMMLYFNNFELLKTYKHNRILYGYTLKIASRKRFL